MNETSPTEMPGRFFEVWENVKNRLREQAFNTVQTASELKAGSARSDCKSYSPMKKKNSPTCQWSNNSNFQFCYAGQQAEAGSVVCLCRLFCRWNGDGAKRIKE